jgi:hypothetical protein
MVSSSYFMIVCHFAQLYAVSEVCSQTLAMKVLHGVAFKLCFEALHRVCVCVRVCVRARTIRTFSCYVSSRYLLMFFHHR